MPVMVLVWDWEIQRLKEKGIVVSCNACQYVQDPEPGKRIARCPILRCQVTLDQPLICSAFKERMSG